MVSPKDFIKQQKSGDVMRPFLNSSALFDMLNADFFVGEKGITYMNGGSTPDNLLAGGSNTQKTGYLVLVTANLLHRHPNLTVFYYDTESTFDLNRLAKKVDELFGLEGYFYTEIFNTRFIYKSTEDGFDGSDLHNFVVDYERSVNETLKKGTKAEKEELYIKTPFLELDKQPIKMLNPLVVIVDSLTDIRFKGLSDKILELDGDVDDGGKRNMRDSNFGNIKRIVFEDCHTYGGMAGVKFYWVAQVVNVINYDGKPMEKDTTFLDSGKKLAKVPKTALQLSHIGYRIIKGTSLINQGDKEWEYPNPSGADIPFEMNGKENPDLIKYEFTTIRNKNGQSGYRTNFIASQTEGILEDLSMYDNIKSSKYFGLIQGGVGRVTAVLYPSETFTRKSVRILLKDNPAFRRAIEITYQLFYLQRTRTSLQPQYRMTPEELYQRIIDQGYDWEDILNNTVYYWHTNPNIKKNTLCILELLKMALGVSKVDFIKRDTSKK